MYTFGKSKRLLTKSDYNQVFSDAKRLSTSEFIVLYRKNNQDDSRLGLAISKKILAKSHDRNRIKRIIRESYRQANVASYDIVVLAKTAIKTQSNHHLFTNLSGLWAKLSK